MNKPLSFDNNLKQKQSLALLLGLIGVGLSLVGFLINKSSFYQSYLTSYLFWLGITVGSLPMIFLHYLTEGQWGYPVRRTLEISTLLIVPVGIFFIPLLFGLKELYPWLDQELVSHDAILQGKLIYLNFPFFLGRAIFYFAIWFLLAFLINKWSLRYDQNQDKPTFGKLQAMGGIGLILFGFTVTFSSVDWVMSLEPHWFSTIYGFMFMIGQTLTGFCFAILVVFGFAHENTFKKTLSHGRARDIGNLLFALIMLWAYISLSQFIIIWSGNLQEEAPWYLKRLQHGWQYLAVFLVFFHFFIPFFILLQRRIKRSYKALASIAIGILVVRWFDLLWVVKPVFSKNLSIHWLDITTFLGLGGLWLYFFFRKFRQSQLTFKNDPIDLNAEEHH